VSENIFSILVIRKDKNITGKLFSSVTDEPSKKNKKNKKNISIFTIAKGKDQ